MPLLILAALVVIVLMLYIALGGKDGAPTISLNKIFEFISPKEPAADENAEAAGKTEAAEKATVSSDPRYTPEQMQYAADRAAAQEKSASPGAAAPPQDATDAKPAEAEGTGTPEPAKQAETGEDGGAPGEAAFASMEELTEFYRKEAERLTGIKH
jgi:hypothetical protein